MAFLAFAIQGVYAIIPRKLMIVGDQLFVKSMTYYSKKIPLDQISRVYTQSIYTWPFPLAVEYVRHSFTFSGTVRLMMDRRLTSITTIIIIQKDFQYFPSPFISDHDINYTPTREPTCCQPKTTV